MNYQPPTMALLNPWVQQAMQAGTINALDSNEEAAFNEYLRQVQAGGNIQMPRQQPLLQKNVGLGIGLALANAIAPGTMDSFLQGRNQAMQQQQQQANAAYQAQVMRQKTAEEIAKLKYGRAEQKNKEFKSEVEVLREKRERALLDKITRWDRLMGRLQTTNLPGETMSAFQELQGIDPEKAAQHEAFAKLKEENITSKFKQDIDIKAAQEKRAAELFPDKQTAQKYLALSREYGYDVILPARAERLRLINKWFEPDMRSKIAARELDSELSQKKYELAVQMFNRTGDNLYMDQALSERKFLAELIGQDVADYQKQYDEAVKTAGDYKGGTTPEQIAIYNDATRKALWLSSVLKQKRDEMKRLAPGNIPAGSPILNKPASTSQKTATTKSGAKVSFN